MLARLWVLLPYSFWLRRGDDLPLHHLDANGMHITIYPPIQGAIRQADIEPTAGVPLQTVMARLCPADPQILTQAATIDGEPAIQANLLKLDFQKTDFDRRPIAPSTPTQLLDLGDPTVRFLFDTVNRFLTRVRAITQGSQVRMLEPQRTYWRLQYLTDAGVELPMMEGLFRTRYSSQFSWRLTIVNSAVWARVGQLDQAFVQHTWETLLLDAEALLPEVGASIVVAAAALETFISTTLDYLAGKSLIPPILWEWINDRESWMQEPSVRDRFDDLLKVLTGRSLKEDQPLWEAFEHLRKTRNSYAHEGKLILGGKALGSEDASRLVGQAKAIIQWVESLLPDEARRPREEQVQLQLEMRIT